MNNLNLSLNHSDKKHTKEELINNYDHGVIRMLLKKYKPSKGCLIVDKLDNCPKNREGEIVDHV